MSVWIIEFSDNGRNFKTLFQSGCYRTRAGAKVGIENRFRIDRECERKYKHKVNFSYRAVKYERSVK